MKFLQATLDRAEPFVGTWGRETLMTHVKTWLAGQLAWCDAADFAEGFAAGVPVEGATPADYNQRVIDVAGSAVLAGIRFRGEAVLEPFVDLVAWEGELDLPAALDVVRREFAVFGPKHVRVMGVGEVAGGVLDQSIHAARAADVVAGVGVVGAAVSLVAWDDPAAAADLVAEAYGEFSEAFREAVVPATEDGLRGCLEDGRLCRIEVGGETAGVWATEPGKVDWLPGQIVVEEVLVGRFRGRGLARSVQRLGAGLLKEDDVLLGTIDRTNEASRRTATGAGRPEVARYTFVRTD